MLELKSRVEYLELMMITPKIFIENYFGDLMNQLDVNTLKIEIENEKKNDGNEKETWGKLMLTYLEEAKVHYFTKIASSYKIDSQLENRVRTVIEDFKKHSKNQENITELADVIYECFLQMKKAILDHDCFVVLSEDKANGLESANIESYCFWRNILPLVKMKNGLISEKGLIHLE